VIITQFHSILISFRANLTAQRPLIKLARVMRKKQESIYKQNTKQDSLYNNGNNNYDDNNNYPIDNNSVFNSRKARRPMFA
jgi:hypothetical protein